MSIIGYGEDGLTLRAVHQQLPTLLQALGDDTASDACKVYYRPSFGRSGGDESPQFGEFDAIVATANTVYLFESKWDSAGQSPPRVVIKEVQRLRHRIFSWLYDRWLNLRDTNKHPVWAEFRDQNGEDFTQTFPNRPLAPDGSLLARNLQQILGELTVPKRSIQNVVLYFHRAGCAPPSGLVTATREDIVDAEFHLLPLEYETIGNSGYFVLLE